MCQTLKNEHKNKGGVQPGRQERDVVGGDKERLQAAAQVTRFLRFATTDCGVVLVT